MKKEQITQEPSEVKKPKRTRVKAKRELPPEQAVVILACLNEDFLTKLNKLAEKEGVKLVLTSNEVIFDYIKNQTSDKIDESARMAAFLKDERNRKLAREHAEELCRILSISRSVKLEYVNELEFSLRDIVRETTLSWKKAEEILNTLEVFGYVKRNNKKMFSFVFSPVEIRENVIQQTAIALENLNMEILRYKGVLEVSSDINTEERKKYLDEFRDSINKNIVF